MFYKTYKKEASKGVTEFCKLQLEQFNFLWLLDCFFKLFKSKSLISLLREFVLMHEIFVGLKATSFNLRF